MFDVFGKALLLVGDYLLVFFVFLHEQVLKKLPCLSGTDLATVCDMNWRIGCSGYHYQEWEGTFYPRELGRGRWFEFYCEHFRTIELNSTFYKFPRVEGLRRWKNRSPEGFLFSVKAPRAITHFRKFNQAQRYLTDFYEAVKEGLGDKLGCVLFQFPSNFTYEEPRLERIVGLLDPMFANVLEFRHSGWWNDHVFDRLREQSVTFCGMDHPTLPSNAVSTSPTLYYRFHGAPHIYVSKYTTGRLESLVREIQRQDVRDVRIYFNNTAEAAAVANAKEMLEMAELVH